MPTVTELIVSQFKEQLRNGRMTPLIVILWVFCPFLQKSLVTLIKSWICHNFLNLLYDTKPCLYVAFWCFWCHRTIYLKFFLFRLIIFHLFMYSETYLFQFSFYLYASLSFYFSWVPFMRFKGQNISNGIFYHVISPKPKNEWKNLHNLTLPVPLFRTSDLIWKIHFEIFGPFYIC